jgi:pimeloyl-ACP methyl ester carboxylesterase
MTEEMPHGELVRAPGAGHMVMMEQADLVTDHIVGLVERCARDRGESRKKWWRRA